LLVMIPAPQHVERSGGVVFIGSITASPRRDRHVSRARKQSLRTMDAKATTIKASPTAAPSIQRTVKTSTLTHTAANHNTRATVILLLRAVGVCSHRSGTVEHVTCHRLRNLPPSKLPERRHRRRCVHHPARAALAAIQKVWRRFRRANL